MTWSTTIPPYTLGPGGDGEMPGFYGGRRLADWQWRWAAGLIDLAATVVVPERLLKAAIPETVTTPVPGYPGYSVVEANPWADHIGLILIVLVLLNSVFLQGRTGQSLGKRLVGIQLTRPAVVDPYGGFVLAYPGVPLSLARLLLHVVDLILLIGFLRPAWHPQRRTFADSLMQTVVLARPQELEATTEW